MAKRKNSILIADDERANISALNLILSPEYIVYASSNGRDALEAAEEFLPDVILLDVMMPDIDGYEVISTLKKNEKTRHIPVVFVTGLDNNDAEEKGLALGAADYITKPYIPSIVKLRVKNQAKLVDHSRALDERLRQQALMAKISHSFLSDAGSDILFANTLRMIGEFMDISSVLLYRADNDGSFICVCEWLKNESINESRKNSGFEFTELFLSDAAEHDRDGGSFLFRHNGLNGSKNNLIAAPIYIKGIICAALVMHKDGDENEWNGSDENIAVLVSDIFSSVFERDAMERQYSIVENSPNLILYISSKANVEYVNPAVYNVTGYTSIELAVRGIGIIFEKDMFDEILLKHIPRAMNGEVVIFEANVISKDATKRILMVTMVKTGKNELGLIATDLTEIRELETGLIAAKERAEHLSRAKSEFLSRMSHEMLTPLNLIMGTIQIANLQPERAKECFGDVDSASRSLLSMIEDMLDISDIDHGVLKLNEAGFNIKEPYQDALAIVRNDAASKSINLVSYFDPAIPVNLLGDKKRFRQVISCLLQNAVKFSNDGGEISIKIILDDKKENTADLRIEVTDKGIGIPAEFIDLLFDPFEQADGSQTRQHGGMGIGLAISKRIAVLMGGDIFVESETGVGSKFIFKCKMLVDGSKSDSGNVVDFTDKHILVVEDMATNRFIIKNLLKKTGIKIIEAENGKRAVEIYEAESEKIDIILMDLRMPEMNGYEAAQRIRQLNLARAADVPIIAISAHIETDDDAEVINAGMNYLLDKPNDPQSLISALKLFL
ncbi:MAG: response regulator [Defluviitaleaceae bacterium]|nr:response regulator [Defluviitaleaceae bacterium]